MEAGKYRKKPVVIEAMQFDGSKAAAEAICRWANDEKHRAPEDDPWADFTHRTGDPAEQVDDLLIHTLEGSMTVAKGDFVICGVAHEFYPCKPDIFAATYIDMAEAGDVVSMPASTAYTALEILEDILGRTCAAGCDCILHEFRSAVGR